VLINILKLDKDTAFLESNLKNIIEIGTTKPPPGIPAILVNQSAPKMTIYPQNSSSLTGVTGL